MENVILLMDVMISFLFTEVIKIPIKKLNFLWAIRRNNSVLDRERCFSHLNLWIIVIDLVVCILVNYFLDSVLGPHHKFCLSIKAFAITQYLYAMLETLFKKKYTSFC